jgi:hypothetical protein
LAKVISRTVITSGIGVVDEFFTNDESRSCDWVGSLFSITEEQKSNILDVMMQRVSFLRM